MYIRVIIISTMVFILQKREVTIPTILLCMLLLVVCQSRLFSHKYTIYDFKRQKGWLYLGKHTFQPPKTQIYLSAIIGKNQIKSNSFLDLEVLAVPVDFWQQETIHQCDVKRYDVDIFNVKAQKQFSFKMMISNQSRVYQTTKQIESAQSKIYYFVLKDCLSTFEKENPSPYSQLKVNLQVKSNDRNYVSNEEHNTWTLPLFIVLSYLVLYFINKQKNQPKNTWPRTLIKISIWASILSLAFKYVDHLYYAYQSGSHSNFLDALNIVCESTADTFVIFLVILMAFGWTIKYDNHQGFTTWMPVCLISYFFLIVIMIMNKSRDTYYNKYHVFDTFAGYIMIVVRIGFYSLFLYGLRKSYRQLVQKDAKLKNFLVQLTIFVSAFIFYIPLSFAVIQLFEKQSRYQVMNLMLQIFQLLLSIWISILICWNGSSYKKIVGSMVVVRKNQKYF